MKLATELLFWLGLIIVGAIAMYLFFGYMDDSFRLKPGSM